MGTLAATLAGGVGGDAGGGTGETDRDRDPFEPNVASSPPLVHTRPFPFIALPFLVNEIAPPNSSGVTERGGTAGTEEGPGAEVDADVH